MSELRFNCPSCGQHLSGDSSYAGQHVTCPKCNAQVLVPPPLPGATTGVPNFRAAPPLGAQTQLAPSASQKTSGLAIASLVCSVGSFIIIPFGFIPGIVCGHLAKKQLTATPGLQGRGLAKAGLIVGYTSLGLHVLAVVAAVAFFLLLAGRVRHAGPVQSSRYSTSTFPPASAPPTQVETTDTQPDGSGWTMQLTGVETPAAAVTGRIQGQPFKPEKVSLQGGWLKFEEGKDFFPDRAMEVVTFEHNPAKLSGRTFTVPTKEFGARPHIWMKWKQPGGNALQQRCFMDRYALRLEFGELAGGKLPGKIYLCVPDQEKSFVMGTFEVPVKGQQ